MQEMNGRGVPVERSQMIDLADVGMGRALSYSEDVNC